MKALFTLFLIVFIGIIVFAVFQLLHRLDTHKVDEGASRRFYEALREQYGLAMEKPKRAMTEDERIALAKKLSDDPFSDVTAADIVNETENSSGARTEGTASEKTSSEDKPLTPEEEQRKISREEALAKVDAILGPRGSSKKDKKKGSAFSELQITLEKYKNK